MKDKLRFFILLLIIVLIIIVIVLCRYVKALKKVESSEKNGTLELTEENNEMQEERLISSAEYSIVSECTNIYLNEINTKNPAFYGYDENGNYINLLSDEDINNNMIQVLSKEYINKNSINTSNVRNFVYKIEEDCFFVPIKLTKIDEKETVKTFGVYGVIITQEYKPVMESYLIVNIDQNNCTFSIQQLKNEDELNRIQVTVPSEIEEKDNNVFSEDGLAQEDLIREYIDVYKRLALTYPELLYDNFLDDDYKNKKFGDIQAFKEYVNSNREEIIGINPAKYEISERGDYTQYITIDDNGNYYIFNAKTGSNYKIILDTYTIDLPEFTERYNSATEQQKVALNIDKFMQAINARDYKYAYSCLADSYKNNYFKTQADFENYAKENFYSINTVEYNEFDTQGGYYTYSVVITDKETGAQKDKTFVMQLGEGTEFVLSFDR